MEEEVTKIVSLVLAGLFGPEQQQLLQFWSARTFSGSILLLEFCTEQQQLLLFCSAR